MSENKEKQKNVLSQAPAETSPGTIKFRVEVLAKTKVKKGNKLLTLKPGIIEKPWPELLEAAIKSPGILHKFGAK